MSGVRTAPNLSVARKGNYSLQFDSTNKQCNCYCEGHVVGTWFRRILIGPIPVSSLSKSPIKVPSLEAQQEFHFFQNNYIFCCQKKNFFFFLPKKKLQIRN